MLRATNTGVTAIIDGNGGVIAAARSFATASVNGEIHGRTGSTPYVSMGNAGFLALAIAMILVGPLAARLKPGG